MKNQAHIDLNLYALSFVFLDSEKNLNLVSVLASSQLLQRPGLDSDSMCPSLGQNVF